MNNSEYIKCPNCKTKVGYKGDGKYTCPKCKGIFKSEENPTVAGKDFGKYRSPIKESNMKTKTLDRLEKMIMKEEESMGANAKIETPLQSSGATPEPAKQGGQMTPKADEPKSPMPDEKPEGNQTHKDFMDAVKPTMEKVKANQIVTWEELKKLADMFDKIGQ